MRDCQRHHAVIVNTHAAHVHPSDEPCARGAAAASGCNSAVASGIAACRVRRIKHRAQLRFKRGLVEEGHAMAAAGSIEFGGHRAEDGGGGGICRAREVKDQGARRGKEWICAAQKGQQAADRRGSRFGCRCCTEIHAGEANLIDAETRALTDGQRHRPGRPRGGSRKRLCPFQ